MGQSLGCVWFVFGRSLVCLSSEYCLSPPPFLFVLCVFVFSFFPVPFIFLSFFLENFIFLFLTTFPSLSPPLPIRPLSLSFSLFPSLRHPISHSSYLCLSLVLFFSASGFLLRFLLRTPTFPVSQLAHRLPFDSCSDSCSDSRPDSRPDSPLPDWFSSFFGSFENWLDLDSLWLEHQRGKDEPIFLPSLRCHLAQLTPLLQTQEWRLVATPFLHQGVFFAQPCILRSNLLLLTRPINSSAANTGGTASSYHLFAQRDGLSQAKHLKALSQLIHLLQTSEWRLVGIFFLH